MSAPGAALDTRHELFWVEDGTLHLDFSRHAGQVRAWDSEKRIVAVLAGSQGGKTVFGPPWLWREMTRRGPGDYMVASPTYKLMQRKLLPTFKRFFEDLMELGTYRASEDRFLVSDRGAAALWGEVPDIETNVFFGHAQNSDSLESATAKAIWSDEAGQKEFRLDSFRALERRGAIYDARHLITTTLYNLGWVVQELWNPWKAAGGDHPDIDVVRFESRDNPAFSQEVWDRLRGSMPGWQFDLQHRAIPTRPAGVIYDSFDDDRDVCPRFEIPKRWPRYLGLDFGAVNTAALFYAREPSTGKFYLYREYHRGGRTASGHADALRDGEPFPVEVRGGSKSEKQWRSEFRAAGLPIKGPAVTEVEVGINRVWGLHNDARIVVFEDCEGYLEEKRTYSRKLDDRGDPTEEIEDKHAFHFMDAERYIMSAQATGTIRTGPPAASSSQVAT